MFKKPLKIGLDIGQFSLKCALLEGNSQIKALWEKEIMPERTSQDQALKEQDRPNRICALLKECPKEIPLFSQPVATALEGAGVISQYMELPPLNKSEIEVAVSSKVIKIIPFPISQVKISFFQVPPLTKTEKVTSVFWIAARKDNIDKIVKLLKGCGVTPASLETPVLPLAREFAFNHRMPKDQFYALVNVGFRWTQVVIVREGFPYFSREIPIAGKTFTYAFQMGTQSAWGEAEKYKLNYDTQGREPQIESFLQRWLDEVQKSLGFFANQLNQENTKIEQVFLSVGGAEWPGLEKRLSDYLKIPVAVDSWEQITDRTQKKHPGDFKVAVGLALEAG